MHPYLSDFRRLALGVPFLSESVPKHPPEHTHTVHTGMTVHAKHEWPGSAWAQKEGDKDKQITHDLPVHTTQKHLDPDRVQHYRDKIRNGEDIGKIHMGWSGGKAWVIDGHHRLAASRLEKQSHISAHPLWRPANSVHATHFTAPKLQKFKK